MRRQASRSQLPGLAGSCVLLLSLNWSVGCSNAPPAALVSRAAGPIGFSGMTAEDANHYIVVHDAKFNESGARLGRIGVGEQGYTYSPIVVADWRDPDGPANDLESVCRLAQRPGEFLVGESSYRGGKWGRLFRVRVTGDTGEVLATYRLPAVAENARQVGGDNFEGLECDRQDDGRYLVILGERGGSKHYSSGWLRWGYLDLEQSAVAWADSGVSGIEVKVPGIWPSGSEPRAISDLYLDADRRIWAVATADNGPNGPFRSMVFQAGSVGADPLQPVTRAATPSAVWVIDGWKVESVAAPAAAIAGSVLGVATEDEHFDGVWRPLFPPAEQR